jgi:hypothetical protein
MKTLYTVALVAQAKLKAYTASVLLLLGFILLPTGEAVGQQAGPWSLISATRLNGAGDKPRPAASTGGSGR